MSLRTYARFLGLFDLRTDGSLIWRSPPVSRLHLLGREAGNVCPSASGKKYWVVQIDKKKVRRSHIVYCMTRGHMPSLQIDHIDGNSLNDAPDNLREATQTQNAWNHKKRAKRLPFPMGVKPLKSGRFQARIACNRKQIALGSYATPDEAHAAYIAARQFYFGEFA